jgi:hypothetical protein
LQVDTLGAERIIKGIMIRQLGEGEERKKRPILSETGFEKEQAADVLADEEIDPADFIDPEEFGIRRKYDPLR